MTTTDAPSSSRNARTSARWLSELHAEVVSFSLKVFCPPNEFCVADCDLSRSAFEQICALSLNRSMA
jgi:hypothetical protein